MPLSTTLPTRKIGNESVAAIGFGAMGLSAFYGQIDDDETRLNFLDEVLASGCNYWDSADIYGDNEDLLAKWFKRSGKRDQVFLATKFAIGQFPNGRRVNGDPEYVHQAINKSLSRLGIDYVDLYYMHRADRTVPIEKTVGAMAELVKAGKVKYLGLSECSAATLRRAHAIHPIAALQVEYSAFTLDIEDEKIALLKTARELGVVIVAYSPLGRGLITGQYKSPDDFEEGDFRRIVPRYSAENFPNILKLADGLKKIGEKHNATAGQVALAFLLEQGDDIIPIPGTRKSRYLKENLGALKIKLTPEDLAEVRAAADAADAANGERYPPGSSEFLFADTPEL